jgi:hypothetical protein
LGRATQSEGRQTVGRQKMKLFNFCHPKKSVSSDRKFVFRENTPLSIGRAKKQGIDLTKNKNKFFTNPKTTDITLSANYEQFILDFEVFLRRAKHSGVLTNKDSDFHVVDFISTYPQTCVPR